MTSLYKEFKDVFVGDLSQEETQELAKFASALVRAKATRDLQHTDLLVKSAAAEVVDFQDFYNVSNLFVAMSKTAEAEGKKGWGKALDYGLKGAMLTSVIAPLAMQAYGMFKNKKAYQDSFGTIMREHPNLANGTSRTMTARNFDAIKQFAPDIAKNSLVAGNVLQRMHRAGTQHMDINVIKELANSQKFVSDFRKDEQGAGFAANLGTAARGITEVFPAKEPVDPLTATREINEANKLSQEARDLVDREAMRERGNAAFNAKRKQFREPFDRNAALPGPRQGFDPEGIHAPHVYNLAKDYKSK